MPKRMLGVTTFDQAVDRMYRLYAEGHRVVVSFSAGKDSGVCVEICTVAAMLADRLPVEVAMRDEEIMFPGTFEYAERVARRDEVDFLWAVANQPIVNVFNRNNPYWWVFDPRLEPEEWVREPPADLAVSIDQQHIAGLINTDRYPPAEGKNLYAVIGLRVSESPQRRMGLYSSGGYLTTGTDGIGGFYKCRPIYDWSDGDIWKAILDNGWDYNRAYDVMYRLGVSRKGMRIGPPTMTVAGLSQLQTCARGWPRWFDKVCERLPGVRLAVQFGRHALEPDRKLGETWKQTFHRTILDDPRAADWIKERAAAVRDRSISKHAAHSTADLPDTTMCPRCMPIGCWRHLTRYMYAGDPFSLKQRFLPPVEPEFFRDGAGTWGGGRPAW